mgnify:CR=1 FL=1
MKFKAAVLEQKKKIRIAEIKDTGLLDDNVIVKMKYSGICGSQIAEYLGLRGKDKYLPHLLGHEGTGIIHSFGKNVKNFKKGDKVFLTWIKPRSKNYKNYHFYEKQKKINAGPITTFSEYTYVSKYCVYKLPKYLDLKKGVLMGCALPTGYGMVKNFSNVFNKKILIVGLGGVGLSCLLTAIQYKPKIIHIFDKNKERLDEIYKKIKKNNLKIVNNLKNKQYDYIFESTGNIVSLQKTIYYLSDNGKCIFASHPKNNLKLKISPHELIKGKKIEGTWGGNVKYPRDIQKIALIIKKNKDLINLFFKKTHSFKNIQLALNEYFKGNTIRPIIKF